MKITVQKDTQSNTVTNWIAQMNHVYLMQGYLLALRLRIELIKK